MFTFRLAVALLTGATLLGACSSTHIANEDGEITGFEWYDPVPHLLVKRAAKSKEIVEASVEILPDLSKKNRAIQSPGIGTSTFKIATKNGVLTEFKQDVSQDGPTFLNKLSSGFKDFAGQMLANEKALVAAKPTEEDGDDSEESADEKFSALFQGMSDQRAFAAELRDLKDAGSLPEALLPLCDECRNSGYEARLNEATTALAAYWRCKDLSEGCRAGELDKAAKAVEAARGAVIRMLMLGPREFPSADAHKRLVEVNKQLVAVSKELGDAKKKRESPGTISKEYGKVAIEYEIYRMTVENGKVTRLERLPPGVIQDLLQAALGG